jgi:apolipoprotein D and lipocalin family protein
MTRLLSGMIALIFSCSALIFAADPVTVERVDLSRYVGQWYEVARLPNAFEDENSVNLNALYTLNSDGTIRVENRCYLNGKLQKVIGLARVDDPKTNAKLGVSFFDVLGFRPVWGDYWILGLGANYTYSVVGDRSRKFAWILSRTPVLAPALMAEAKAVLARNGYDVSRLIYPKNG